MPYLVSAILAVSTAMIIMFTRYEADDSSITAELDRIKSMFVTIDGFVNTYIESSGNLTSVNFEELYKSGILLSNMVVSPASDDNLATGQNETTTSFSGSQVVWQLIPNIADSSSYKLLVDMRDSPSLMRKVVFAESFSSREFCEKMLFGNSVRKGSAFVTTTKDFGISGTESDGLFVCIVFK